MKFSGNLGMILVSIWLILTGLLSLLSVNFPNSGLVLAVLAIAAGVVLLLGLRGTKLSGNLGLLLLGIWLVLTGLLPLINISFPGSGIVLAILAAAAGILILLRR